MKFKYVLLVLTALIVLALAYYGISPIFRTVEVNEATPQEVGEEVNEVAEVMSTVGHPASGTARIVEADGKTYVRYEDFKTLNGPDLFVYLAKDLDAKEFVNLGALRATEGNINYEVPEGVDVSEYRYVMVWCRAFSVLFNYADISSVE